MLGNLAETVRHYLAPHHTNNYRAKALHHPILIFYILLLLFFQTFYSLVKGFNPNILGFATDISAQRLLYLVNLEREKAGLSQLSLSPDLNLAAENKGKDMFEKNYWAHISPTGTTPWEFITKTGYQYVFAGENLAKSFDKSDEVVAAWMKSPTHKANILKPEYTEIGFAVKNGILSGEETTLVVQEFGSRVNPVTPKPKEVKANIPTTDTVQVQAQTSKTSRQFFRINRQMSLFVAEFMLFVLFIDSIFIWKHRTFRIRGHSLAHIMFLLALLGAASATGIGAIL